MNLTDIKTLKEVARDYNISSFTLKTRLSSKKLNMIEGIDFRILGPRMPTLLSPQGVIKILKGEN